MLISSSLLNPIRHRDNATYCLALLQNLVKDMDLSRTKGNNSLSCVIGSLNNADVFATAAKQKISFIIYHIASLYGVKSKLLAFIGKLEHADKN